MASAAVSARRGYVLGALVLAVTTGILWSSAPASSNGGGLGCGRVVKRSIKLSHDLLACPADGLVVAAHGITIDLNGKIVDGVSFGVGIRNDGFDGVEIRNGTIREFDYGVQLNPGTRGNLVTKVTVSGNELAGIQLSNADGKNRVTNSIVERQAGDGIALVNGSAGNRVFRNTIRNNQNNGVFVQRSSGNRISRNGLASNSNRNVVIEMAHRNSVLENTLTGSGDGAVEVTSSHKNVLARNTVSASGDAGFVLTHSWGNRLLGNSATGSSDAGAFLQYSNKNTLRGNTFARNPSGIELSHSNSNLIASNTASANMGNGINLEDSNNNRIRQNTANSNQATGIYVVSESLEAADGAVRGNVISGNSASRNGRGGLDIASPGHTITANTTNWNRGWGIAAVPGTTGRGNSAWGNAEAAQCSGIFCALRAHGPRRKPHKD